jgi:anhydro-N-acetylmuramic acid kinase
MRRVIGLMSGTSLDGVDAAWIETDGETIGRLGPALTLPYDDALRRTLRALLERAATLAGNDPDLIAAVRALTLRHAEAVEALRRSCALTVDLIGFHGQTILHQPAMRRTWQVGDAALLAERTGLPVVHDFRSADVAAGGQGAPLVPIFHAALARSAGLALPVAFLNIGGVANVTYVGAEEVAAMDVGPGNGPLDDWVFARTGAAFDRDGALAASGAPEASVLAALLADPFFAAPGPKSLDRLDFSAHLAASGLDRLSAADGAATLVAFTVGAIAAARLPGRPSRWLVCGGGRRNSAIMRALRAALGAAVEPVETEGWDGDAIEAECFGHLAARSLAGLPITFPGTTGAPRPLTGGRLTQP